MPESDSLSHPRVLYIEDNELNRDMLSRRLGMEGIEILLAEDAEVGIEMARQTRPRLILMDLSLPGLDGWAATRQIKSDPELGNIPVLALTAHAMVDDRQRALDAGCDDYDTKPIDINRLLAKIRTLLEQK